MGREGLISSGLFCVEIGNFVSQLLHVQSLELNPPTISCYGVKYNFKQEMTQE